MSDTTKISWFQLKAVSHRVNTACLFPVGRARYIVFRTEVLDTDKYALLYDDVVIFRGDGQTISGYLADVERRALVRLRAQRAQREAAAKS